MNKVKLLYCRTQDNGDALYKKLSSKLELIYLPLIKFCCQPMSNIYDHDIKTANYIIFTSSRAVTCAIQNHLQVIYLSTASNVAIGDITANKLIQNNFTADLIPKESSSEGVLSMLLPKIKSQDKVVIFSGQTRRGKIYEKLQQKCKVLEIVCYKTQIQDINPKVVETKISTSDLALITSEQTIYALENNINHTQLIQKKPILTISPRLEKIIRTKYKCKNVILAKSINYIDIINTIENWSKNEQTR